MEIVVSELNSVRRLPIDAISTMDHLNFRIQIDQGSEFQGLIESVRKHGLLHPLIVRERKGGKGSGPLARKNGFQLICGRRRLEACRRLGMKSVPCSVVDLDDREVFELTLVENVQRQSLNSVEEAEAFKTYVLAFGRGSIVRLAQRIGKSEEYVSHRLLLLGLPKVLTERISRRLLNPSFATELVWLKDPKKQIELADEIQAQKLTHRQIRLITRIVREKETSVREAVDMANAMMSQTLRAAASSPSKTVKSENIPDVSWPDYSDVQPQEGSEERILDRATLVMRASLVGLDFLIERVNSSSDLRDALMTSRRKVHSVLDELIQVKVVYLRDKKTRQLLTYQVS